MRFLRDKMDISQQKMADKMGVNRANIASYEKKYSANNDFRQKLVNILNIDLSKFLTVAMNDYNYSSFFTTNNPVSAVEEPIASYKKLDIFGLLVEIKNSDDHQERAMLIDHVISIYGKVLDENGALKSEITILQRDLLAVARKR